MKDVIVGTAGHIDHGKTTLLKALTGIDADRLQEEKRRGITIDLGFAHMPLGENRVGFVDVPGHERFVKNMLAGIGGIQLVLLVVAADESVMPQTVEHFQICRLLNIPAGLVVITKKDLVDEELLALVKEEVRDFLKGSFMERAPLVEVDSVSGSGLDHLKDVLLEQIEDLQRRRGPLPDCPKLFRFPIDRVFSIRGFGTVVTGTPQCGQIEKEAVLQVHPLNRTVKVRGIQIFNEASDQAGAGQRTALNLSGLEKRELERGMVLTAPDVFDPSPILDAYVSLIDEAGAPLKNRDPVRFHHGSVELLGRIYLLKGSEVAPGGSALAQLRLDRPALCCPGDRFILRRYSPMTTVGGGIVLDNAPPKHRKKELPELLPRLEHLQSRLAASEAEFVTSLIQFLVNESGPRGMDLKELAARTGIQPQALERYLPDADSILRIEQDPLLLMTRESLESTEQRVLSYLKSFHQRHPLAAGVPREELKRRFVNRESGGLFPYLLKRLESSRKIRVDGSSVALYGVRPELSPEQLQIRDLLLEILKKHDLQPPPFQELLSKTGLPLTEVRDVFYFLVLHGELVRVTEDIVLAPERVMHLKERLKERFSPGQTMSVSDFKDLFQISRRFAIPYLEFLDREKVTRRLGDKRLIL